MENQNTNSDNNNNNNTLNENDQELEEKVKILREELVDLILQKEKAIREAANILAEAQERSRASERQGQKFLENALSQANKIKQEAREREVRSMKLSVEITMGATATANKKVISNNSTKLKKCVICLDHERNRVFIPCGHLCICGGCEKDLDVCPICFDNFISINPVFIP